MTRTGPGSWLAVQSASPFHPGQVIAFHFETFTPQITIRSERELTVDVVAGAHLGFSDTVEYQAVRVRDDLVVLSWREHNGSTIAHTLDLRSNITYAAVTPATGDFMRWIGRIEIKPDA